MIDLIAEHLAAIHALCRQYGVLRLDLFGSAATGAFNEATSDLDFIATFADTQKPGYAMRYLHFAEALEALFGRSVDLITDGSIRNPYFQEEVDETRQPVYRALGATALHDILESCEAIASYTEGLDFGDYQADSMVRDAVERRLGIIGEALNRVVELSPELEDRVPDLRDIVGLRNRLIHGYRAVDDHIIWDAIQVELPHLEASVTALLADQPPG